MEYKLTFHVNLKERLLLWFLAPMVRHLMGTLNKVAMFLGSYDYF